MISPLSSASGMKVPGEISAAGRMLPAHQRLEADDLAADARLRLVVQGELVALDRRAQILLQRAPLAQPLVHVGFEEADRAAAVRLGAIERGVGVAEQRRSASAPSTGKIAMPMLKPTRNRMALDVDLVVDRREQPIAPWPRPRAGCSPSVAITTNSSPPSRARKAPPRRPAGAAPPRAAARRRRRGRRRR